MIRTTSLLKTSALALPLSCGALAAQAADIAGALEESEQFTTLAEALAAAGLIEPLQGEGPFTVFAPTDQAFQQLPPGALDRLLAEENRDQLRALLGHHVVRGEAFPADAIPERLEPLEGGPIAVDLGERGVVLQPDRGGQQAVVVEGDIEADNGVIHAIDAVLVPQQVAQALQLTQVAAADLSPSDQFPTIALPAGFQIEKVAEGLTYPTALAWDDQGQLYVAEAGGGLNPEQLEPSRILRVENGRATEVVNLTDQGVFAAVVGLTWHEGAFYITHRNAEDLTGAASRVTPEGEVTELFSGIVDSQAEHQINAIRVGPGGRMYVAVGPAGNAAVVGPDLAPWVMESPDLHTTACRDIVLTGRNFESADFRTEDDPGDTVLTGAFVPFGTETEVGETIAGTAPKCGGSILVFDPADAEATLAVHAWGFRNIIGLAWGADGTMYAAVNGYDIRGSRPVNDEFDATYRVEQGVWYGWPDFSAGLEPLTDPKFEVPDEHQATVVVNGEQQGKNLGFVIDHEASGLTPPDPALVVGRHEFHSSPSMLDVAPDGWGDLAGQVFVAEWGDLTPPTDPTFEGFPGYQVTRIDPANGQAVPFVRNVEPGPASEQGAQGEGIERPFDVKFGPDGAMYIVDYGVVTINMDMKPPYNYQPQTGVIWRVTQMGR